LSALFDTSVLIPVFLEDHPHHQRSLSAFVKTNRQSDYCAAHSLAEVYAAMTRLPGRFRPTREQVLAFLEDINARLTCVTLTASEYRSAIRHAAELGVSGGTIYDALIARCAVKANVDTLYTWNQKHFEQIASAIGAQLKTP
jgi:predicted nucleic acid-binding protein